MKTAAIICECDPAHMGHKYLIDQARTGGADVILCIMSGFFTQRGSAAMFPPHVRAEALLAIGADLVVELPTPYSFASAEFFASAGVEIAVRMGADELWFGSECGDIALLSEAARVAESKNFQQQYAESTAKNAECGRTEAFLEGLSSAMQTKVAFSSNDILAISYLRAMLKTNAAIKPVTVKRRGAAFSSASIAESGFSSATALRQCVLRGELEVITAELPAPAPFLSALERGAAPVTLSSAERLILGYLRLTPPAALFDIFDLGGGLCERVCKASAKAVSYEELISLCSTKKYTNARICRGILFALLGVTAVDVRRSPAYTRLLGCNSKGEKFLAATRKTREIPMVTRQSNLPTGNDAERQTALTVRAEALYALCNPHPTPAGAFFKEKPKK